MIIVISLSCAYAYLTSCDSHSTVSEVKISARSVHQKNRDRFISYAHQIESDFRVLYFGRKKKAIKIDAFNPLQQNDIYNYIMNAQRFSDPNILFILGLRLPTADSKCFQVTIDTSTIYEVPLYRRYNNTHFSRYHDTILAYPIIIENISDHFYSMFSGNQLQMDIQAKNEKGDWEYITFPFQRFCGTGILSYPIFPGEVVVSSIPVFQGEFSTVGRIKIDDFYSEEFPIKVNKEIFISLFPEEFKEESY